jgi:CheY-like chemotaxis protein
MPDEAGAKIVVADDDDDLRKVVAACLRRSGYSVLEAADGHQAVALVRAERPDLLLLDIWMPEADGLSVLETLRHDPAADRTAIVLLTGDQEADARLEALAAGAVGCITKGGGLDELCAAIASHLNQRRSLLDPGAGAPAPPLP